MKYLTFSQLETPREARLGAMLDQTVIHLDATRTWANQVRSLPPEPMPESLFEFIHAGPAAWIYGRNLVSALEGEDPLGITTAQGQRVGIPLEEVLLHPPLPRPMSLRDFYAFEAHVARAHAIRGKKIPDEWYQFPAFYYSNANAIFGPGETIPYPAYTEALDYELEVACIIGKPGIDISADHAERYIFGYTILNDWSARDVQRKEMKVGLGPAKGKDFATSLGPWVVTPDELASRSAGEPGIFNLAMAARVNGRETSRGNWRDLHYSFGEMIARASQSAWLLPGDVLGSGTVGTGCLLETTQGRGPWLQPDDVVELEIESLGVLINRIGRRNE